MRLITTRLPVTSIEKGMVIIEHQLHGKPRRVEVSSVVHSACSSRDTHVNGNMCYSKHATVEILTGTEKSPDEMNVNEIMEQLGIDPALVKS